VPVISAIGQPIGSQQFELAGGLLRPIANSLQLAVTVRQGYCGASAARN
jgi:hypothetical protein